MNILKRVIHSLAFAATGAMLLMQANIAHATAGAYSSSAVGQTIYTKNTAYQDNFPIVGSPPASGSITSVSYSWSFSSWPSGLTVWLCQGSTNACINVSSSQRGSTTAFSTRSPTSPFFLYYYVSGTGTMTPVYSNNNNVIVNWQ